MPLRLTALFLALLATPLHAEEAKLKAIASFSILADMVQTIGGDAVDVSALVGPDGDAHDYQPTPDDVKKIAGADIVFVNGLGFEGWIGKLVLSSGTKAKVITASRGVTPRMMKEESHNIADPHAWHDIANARLYARNIADGLKAALPAKASAIAQRAKAYDAELARLDKEAREALKPIAPEKRKIITSHDAFGYLGAAYGISFLAPQGALGGEVSAKTIAALIRQVKAEGVKVVFLENMNDPRLARQLAKDTGATLGGTLYSDALSPPSGPAPGFTALFRHNLGLLAQSMGR